MSNPQVKSLFSGDLAAYIRRNLVSSQGLVSAFQRLPPALAQLRAILDLDKDVTVRQQYRALCRSLREAASETLAFMDILEGVLSLGRNRERWGRIDRELEAAFESGSRHGSVLRDQQSSYPHLTDFEAELQLRVERLEQAQNKLRLVCQQIEQNMFICSQGTADLSLVSMRIAKKTVFGALTFGTFVFVLGLAGFEEISERLPLPLGVTILTLLGICYKVLSSRYSSLEQAKIRSNEAATTVRSIVSEVTGHARTDVRGVAYISATILQVRQDAEKFFQERNADIITANRAKLQSIFASLQ
jgi:ABC-type multidrug transport system fused ATPase/permease subunit